MTLTKPNQELRRDLQGAAALLKWSVVDLMKLAVRLSEAGREADSQEILKIIQVFPDAEDRLAGYADEVRDGRIGRAASQCP